MSKQKKVLLPRLSRRQFLAGTGAAVGASTLNLSISSQANAGGTGKTLVYVFLRGGIDGFGVVAPISGPDATAYSDVRDRVYFPPSGRVYTGGPSTNEYNYGPAAIDIGSGLGFNPVLTRLGTSRDGLKEVYDAGNLAVVMAAGHPPDEYTRSHFDAQEQIELGTPGEQNLSSGGWLARYLNTSGDIDPDAIFTALATSSNPPSSLAGYPDVANLASPDAFHPNSGTYAASHLESLLSLYSGTKSLDLAGQTAVGVVREIQEIELGDYQPAGGADYPNTGFADDLQLIAQLLRQNIKINVATAEIGGWDTHQNQLINDSNRSRIPTYYGFNDKIRDLSQALAAFHDDMQGSGLLNDVCVVVQSEFGRQINENANRGTDHGLGNVMFVMGGGITGGLYGDFPGISNPNEYIGGNALRVTTDFRRVLATVVREVMGNNNVPTVFPGYNLNGDGGAMGFA